MSWLALDIGGANLKGADGLGFAVSRPFALWKAPERLASELATLVDESPRATQLAITMTGELADCYPDRATGVREILSAAATAARGLPLLVYRTDGRLAPAPHSDEWITVAASNWRALAEFSLRFCPERRGVLIDIGSTTTDLIPLLDGRVAAAGLDDFHRLRHGELVYTGVERTPLCAVVNQLHTTAGVSPVTAELFATTVDAYLVLGDLPEQPEQSDTADGRPRTRAFARQRIGRMLCTEISDADAVSYATQVQEAQLQQLESAWMRVVERLGGPPDCVVLSGHGEFLSRRLLARQHTQTPPRVVSLTDELGPVVSRCGPAHGLAILAIESELA